MWLEFTGRKFRIPLAVLDLVRIPVNKVKKERVKKVRLYFIILSFFHDHGQKLALSAVEPPVTATVFGGQSIH